MLIKLMPITLVALHSAVVGWLAGWMWLNYSGPGYQEELQLWAIVSLIDLPVALLGLGIDYITDEWIYEHLPPRIAYVACPAVFYLILGGLQWFLAGLVVRVWFGLTLRARCRFGQRSC